MIPTTDLSVLIDRKFATKPDKLRDNSPKFIVLHSTKNYPDYDSLYFLHTRIYQWNGIGYHVFVSNGKAYLNRDFEMEGAHCLGLNFNSIGLCIHLKNHIPKTTDLDIAKNVIAKIRSQYGPLPLISHTKGQIRYINKLSEKKGLTTGVPEGIEIASEYEFMDIKERLMDFSNREHLDKHPYLNSLIKNFKNCPGTAFYDFIKEVNQND